MCAKCLAYYLEHIPKERQLIFSFVWKLEKFLYELIFNVQKLGLTFKGLMKGLRKCPESSNGTPWKWQEVRCCCIVRHDSYHTKKALSFMKEMRQMTLCLRVCSVYFWHSRGKENSKACEVIADRNSKILSLTSKFTAQGSWEQHSEIDSQSVVHWCWMTHWDGIWCASKQCFSTRGIHSSLLAFKLHDLLGFEVTW